MGVGGPDIPVHELEAHRRFRKRASTPFQPLVERQAVPAPLPSSSTIALDDEDFDPCDDAPDTVAIVVLVVSIVLVAIFVGLGCFYWRRARRRATARTHEWRLHLPHWLTFDGGRKRASATGSVPSEKTAPQPPPEMWTGAPGGGANVWPPPPTAQYFAGLPSQGRTPLPQAVMTPNGWATAPSNWVPQSHWDGSIAYGQHGVEMPVAAARRPTRRERRRDHDSSSDSSSEDDRPRRSRSHRRRGDVEDMERAKAAALANARKGMAEVRRQKSDRRPPRSREDEDDEYGFDIEPDNSWSRGHERMLPKGDRQRRRRR